MDSHETLAGRFEELLLRDRDADLDGTLNALLALVVLKRSSDEVGSGSLPVAACWNTLRDQDDLGGALEAAARALEVARPELRGVLTAIDFRDERAFGEPRRNERLLRDLVLGIDEMSFRDDAYGSPALLGSALVRLLDRVAIRTARRAGSHHVPRGLARLMVELVQPTWQMTLCDVEVSDGGVLGECLEYLRERSSEGSASSLDIAGQERTTSAWALARMVLHLGGCARAQIEKGDALRSPRLVDANGDLRRFDRVILHAPFNLNHWGAEELGADELHRFPFGVPVRSDLAYVQHTLAALEPEGRAVALVAPGVLFRADADAPIRRALVVNELVTAVVGLPPRLLLGTSMPSALLLLQGQSARIAGDGILFVRAEHLFENTKGEVLLGQEHIDQITGVVRSRASIPRFSQLVSAQEIAANAYNLSVSRYIDGAAIGPEFDSEALVAEIRRLECERDRANNAMDRMLADLMDSPAKAGPLQAREM